MAATNPFNNCRRPNHDTSHYGEYLLQKLTLFSAALTLAENDSISVKSLEDTSAAAVSRRHYAVANNKTGRICINDIWTGEVTKSIQTGPNEITCLKVLNMCSELGWAACPEEVAERLAFEELPEKLHQATVSNTDE